MGGNNMPVLNIKGLPNGINPQYLLALSCSLRGGAGRMLNLSEEEVSVFFQADLLQDGLGEELICSVEGLFKKPERTPELRQRLFDLLSVLLGLWAKVHLPQCAKVEILPVPFDQEVDGFAMRDPRK